MFPIVLRASNSFVVPESASVAAREEVGRTQEQSGIAYVVMLEVVTKARKQAG